LQLAVEIPNLLIQSGRELCDPHNSFKRHIFGSPLASGISIQQLSDPRFVEFLPNWHSGHVLLQEIDMSWTLRY
jgi:hypothetical protein